MKVKLLAHTQLNCQWLEEWEEDEKSLLFPLDNPKMSDGQAVSMTAIRTCYSHLVPSSIIENEADKYFNSEASDGQGGTDADRLIRFIIKSGHTSTMEHLNFTFSIEGVSRSLLAQITRHRHFSFSVQSQRYVKFGSDDKSYGFNYILPETVERKAKNKYFKYMQEIQEMYDSLRESGIPAEDARMILPNAACCNMVMTGNLRTILEFCSKRLSKQAQWEIRELAEEIKEKVVSVEPWTKSFFE